MTITEDDFATLSLQIRRSLHADPAAGKFSLGRLFVTPGVMAELEPEEVAQALGRHARGDWGDVCEEDRQSNEEAPGERLRLFSVYHSKDQTKFWIITEADRSATTVLLPSEY